MGKEEIEESGFAVGEKVLNVYIHGGRKSLRMLTVKHVVADDGELRIFVLEVGGYFGSDEIYSRKAVLEIFKDKMPQMDEVFAKAKAKALLNAEVKKLYTLSPWTDFPEEFLVRRLEEEFKEWKVEYNKDELLDIINMAIFAYLGSRVGW